MALQAVYQQFLAAPNASFLTPNASLHYITTLVTLNGSSEIIKHLNGQSHELKKKEEKFLDVVEAADALAVEVQTCIEFIAGGGAYLPKLDDNFLADRTVSLPIIHIVSFDANRKITQIRQSWDQGSLLKLIDVIGKTGRNWPIHDGKDQIKLIANSVKSAGKTGPNPATQSDEVPDHIRSRGNSNNVTRDPHASLELFAPRQKIEQEVMPNVVAPKGTAKPAQRNYHDLFVGNESDGSPNPASQERDESPSRNHPRAPKAGAAKNYAPSRLFDADEDPTPAHAENFYRPSAARYQHFDFAEHAGEELEAKTKPLQKVQPAKHGAQWNFDDFNTPQKIIPTKVLRNEVRHWGNSDDENINSPVHMQKVDKPRKDAQPHFEFQDDGTPTGERRLVGRPRGQGQNNGLGLYKDNMFDDDDEQEIAAATSKPSLANVKERNKVFDPHFTMTDDSPASTPAPNVISQDRAKVVKMMDANWAASDQSPSQKENVPVRPANRSDVPKGINVAGDGMGGKKGLSEVTNTVSNKGINVGGDGMGGKKGLGRSWGFGDESDGEEAGGVNKPSKYRTGKTQAKQAAGGDFWDF